MAKLKHETLRGTSLYPLSELKEVVPEACLHDDLIGSMMEIIGRNLRPLDDPTANSKRIVQLIERYVKTLKRRGPDKRPRTKAGSLKSLEAFVTKDIRAASREYADFEARAEKLLVENHAMHLTEHGIERHQQRALDIIGRFMQTLAEQTEHLSCFRVRLQQLENEFFDRDNWTLHLHDRLNRLANFLTAIDAAVTSLKRAILLGRPFARALESLRALRDDSLNPLEFIGTVFAGHEYPYEVRVSCPTETLNYSNHFLVREILLELVHNAIANNASLIDVSMVAQVDQSITIAVVDNCPGGMPREILTHIGTRRIHTPRIIDVPDLYGGRSFSAGWGLYAVCTTMVPRLGEGSRIDFFSPVTPEGGTRVLLTVPVINKIACSSASRTEQSALMSNVPPCLFRSMDPFATAGLAMNDRHLASSMLLPL